MLEEQIMKKSAERAQRIVAGVSLDNYVNIVFDIVLYYNLFQVVCRLCDRRQIDYKRLI